MNQQKKLGLNDEQVRASRNKYGSNTLDQVKRKSFFRQFISSFGDPIIKILLVALAVNILFLFKKADWFETVGIAIAIFLATFISTLSEYGSESAFLELQRSAANITCRVQRAKGILALPITELVVGDLVLLQAGERIPADGILLSGNLNADQSALNGESKEAEKLPSNTTVLDWDLAQKNQLFQGSVITSGEGLMEVRRVGAQTFYGSMAQELHQETPDSPLKLRLDGLAKFISRLGYIAAALIAFADLFNSFILDNQWSFSLIANDFSSPSIWVPRILHALTLATAVVVMAVPEGLPMMITVVLSSNMFRMLKDQVMVRKLVGIETSGSLNLLFTDKTGTLTEGKLKVINIIEGSGKTSENIQKCSPAVQKIIKLTALYNTGCTLSKNKPLGGNATERALLESILPLHAKRETYQIKSWIPFDSTKKFCSVQIQAKDSYILVKGAPEKIFDACHVMLNEKGEKIPFNRKKMESHLAFYGSKAIRMLAIALSPKKVSEKASLENLTFVAMIGIRDGLRKEVPRAVAEVQSAGVQIVMMTGDSKETAAAIARDAGLLNNSFCGIYTSRELATMSDHQIIKILPTLRVVARALPTDKSRLIRLAQEAGMVAGMTGDGINDAPALKRADVGFAMGGGTEVAKEASDIIILDNNFASISKAIRYGRTIFKSIRKFIIYQFSMNLCAVGVSLIGPFIGIDTPVTVIQMLWINIIMDTLAGLAFSGEAALAEYMKEPPKQKEEPVLNRKTLQQILWMGLYTMGLCLAFLWLPYFRITFGFSENPIHFLTAFYALFIFSGVFNSFNARTERINLFAHLRKNPAFILIMSTVSLVQILMIYYGGHIFRTAGLSFKQFRMILLMAFSVIPADLLRKIIHRKY